jgi:MFS family permease
MNSPPASGQQLSGARSRAVYVLLLALGALDAAGYSVIAPVLPTLASQTGGGATAMGMLVATFPLGMVAGFAAGGFAIQRSTPAKVMLGGLLLICAGCLGFAFRTGLVDYGLARLVMGLGSGCLWLGITFATLAAWPGQEYVCMSRIFAAYSVGGLLGPLLGSIHGVRGPFAAYLLLAAAAMVPLLVLRLPARAGAFTADRGVLRSRDFRAAGAGIAFAVLALGLVEGVLPLHFGTRLGQSEIGLLYAATSVLVATVAVLAARLRPRAALLGSTVPLVAGFTAVGAGSAVPVWIGALILVGAGIGMANTGSIGLLLEAVPAGRIVTAMVLWSQIGILGYLLAPVLGGPLADAYGYTAVAGLVAVAAVAVVVALGVRGRK